MNSDKIVLNNSPYIGVLAVMTEEMLLVPYSTTKKEETALQNVTGLEPIRISIAETPLLGAFIVAYKKKVAVPDITSIHEIRRLEEHGIKVGKVGGRTALGNLFRVVNDTALGPSSEQQFFQDIERILGLKVNPVTIARSSLIGSSMAGNANGFAVRPDILESEMENIEKLLGLEGVRSTANYGDRFLGNSVIANSNSIVYGVNTTTHEIFRIENALASLQGGNRNVV